MSSEFPAKILVFQTAFLGDVFLSIPLLRTLKKNFPQASLALVCRKNFGEFFLKTKTVDFVFEVDKKNSASLKEVFNQTKEYGADLIISPHQSFRTAFWVKKLNAKIRIGFNRFFTNWAYTKTMYRDKLKHDALRQLSLLEALDLPLPTDEILFSKSDVPALEKFSHLKNFVALAPGSQWATKRWRLEGFIECSKQFIEEGKQVVIVGGADEKALGDKIHNEVPQVFNLVGQTTIYELSQLLSQAKLLITNDNGAMHVATTVGVPVVSIFGPTVQEQGYFPWSKRYKVVEQPMGCRPCGAHGHHQCPLNTHDCMRKISAEKVLQAAHSLL